MLYYYMELDEFLKKKLKPKEDGSDLEAWAKENWYQDSPDGVTAAQNYILGFVDYMPDKYDEQREKIKEFNKKEHKKMQKELDEIWKSCL